jgi:Family of unknown function (DUF6962)
MKISEPVTVLTNCALALVVLPLGGTLWPESWQTDPASLWGASFFVVGGAALTGAVYHGIGKDTRPSLRIALWNLTVYMVGAGSSLMIAAVVVSPVAWSDTASVWLLGGAGTALVALLVQQSGIRARTHFNHNDFSHVIQILAMVLFYMGARLVI